MQSIEERIARVRNDREHGSRWLMQEALLIVRDLAAMPMASQDEHMQQLYRVARALSQARPAMAALASVMGSAVVGQNDPAAIVQTTERLLRDYDSATEHIARYARPFLHGTLMTCSISGTVLDVLVMCRQAITQVIALEGRPRYEGREMAYTLSQQGFTVSLITDAQADIFLPQCQGVVVGADSVLADGDVLNKAGTALLAWAAQGHHVPFYVLCETAKISPQHWSPDELDILEEKEPEEVLTQPPDGVMVRNFYFDHTPYKLINTVITERGILTQQSIQEIAAHTAENARFLAAQQEM